MHIRPILLFAIIVLTVHGTVLFAEEGPGPVDYQRDVAPVFRKYCAGCHNAMDREGDLSLDSYLDLTQGNASGPVVLAGQAESSLLMRVLTGDAEPTMPPEDHEPPTQEEIDILARWIEAGAVGPEGARLDPYQLVTPRITSLRNLSPAITALELSADGQQLAIGRFGRIELIESVLQEVSASIEDLPGKINSIKYSPDGRQIVVATGITGVVGRADVYSATDGKLWKSFDGHRDIVTDAEFSPNRKFIATCSYDRRILIWRTEDGALVHEITGHNGAVFDIAFSPDGSVVASASADETVKLWNVETGERLDTLSQPSAEQYVVAFSPDARSLVAGGADHRIRVWDFVSRERPRINPLRFARFAHEGSIVALAWTHDGKHLLSAADDHSMKLWETANFAAARSLQPQSDVISGLSMAASGNKVVVGRMDGSWEILSIADERRELDHRGELVVRDPPEETDADEVTEGGQTLSESNEQEPNDRVGHANSLEVPSVLSGIIHAPGEQPGNDVDFFRFEASAGERLIIEIQAARNDSLLDSAIEVVDRDGQRIERVLLQAVRDSYVTFEGRDSDTVETFRLHNWTEMELNEYLYLQGEVCKLWLYPNGPDAGFRMYPGEGKRFTYFGTTALSHCLNETCYIVEPHPPGTDLVPNGLPVFPIYYENDDDDRRQLGMDSRLDFTAPTDGEYLVRVRDTRGFGGEKYHYQLTVRKPRPDFEISVELDDVTIPAGSGKEFKVSARRSDGFDDEIRVDIAGLPPGFSATSPVIVQGGQVSAWGVVVADKDAASTAEGHNDPVTITASAMIGGRQITKSVEGIGDLKIGDAPKLRARVTGLDGSHDVWGATRPLELEIEPGSTISARVVLQRNDHDGDVLFGGDGCGRNLPHGVLVDNIGLNGLTVTSGINEREIFITAAKWVPETTRMFHLKAKEDGGQATPPVILHVRRRSEVTETARLP